MTRSAKAMAMLVGLLLAAPLTGHAASFDCARPDLADDERTICATPALNDDDVRMATMYEMLTGLVAMGQRGDMQDRQAAWLKDRHACGPDADCLRGAYRQRIDALKAAYDALPKPM